MYLHRSLCRLWFAHASIFIVDLLVDLLGKETLTSSDGSHFIPADFLVIPITPAPDWETVTMGLPWDRDKGVSLP